MYPSGYPLSLSIWSIRSPWLPSVWDSSDECRLLSPMIWRKEHKEKEFLAAIHLIVWQLSTSEQVSYLLSELLHLECFLVLALLCFSVKSMWLTSPAPFRWDSSCTSVEISSRRGSGALLYFCFLSFCCMPLLVFIPAGWTLSGICIMPLSSFLCYSERQLP